MLRRFAAAFLLAAFAAPAFAAPEVLIVQRMSNKDGEFNVPVAMKLKEELDLEGRVSPILWSMLDPVFRAYIDDGKLPGFVENPDDKTIRDYAGKLKVAYVLIVEAVAVNGRVIPQANVYSGTRTRPMWSMVREENRGRPPRLVVIEDGKVDEEKTKAIREKYTDIMEDGSISTMTVYVNGAPDWPSTAASLARTWTRILAEGPFKHLEPLRRTFPIDPDRGLGFDPGTAANVDTGVEIDTALEQARLLAADGHADQAILVLREAIDTAPFSSAPRIKLAELLIDRGHPEVAALESERAANMTDKPGLMWKVAAESWVRTGNVEKATNAANEARARGVDSSDLLLTMGDIWLLKGEYGKAIDQYDASLTKEASARAYLGRALAKAISGDGKGAAEDIELAQGREPLPLGEYQRAMDILDAAVDKVVELLRSITQGVRIENGPDMVPSATSVQKRTAAIVDLMVMIRVPAKHKESHDGRDLAYKLLAQSAVEALVFAKTKSQDADFESALSLSEATKLLPRVREIFRIERTYTQTAMVD